MIEPHIFVKVVFEFLHRWPDAKGEFEFLANLHHHHFSAEVHMSLSATADLNSREIEFFDARKLIKQHIEDTKSQWPVETSCETMAKYIMAFVRKTYGHSRKYSVVVSEDETGGAYINYDPER